MSEVTDLAVIEIKPDMAPALYVPNGLDAYLDQIRQAVSEVPDLSTKKGRDRVASLAAQVSRSKTAIEKPGREYLKRLKEAVRPAEAEIKRFVDACDELRDATRRPLTEWEAEQDRLKSEEAARIKAEEDRKQFEADHEMALLMNDAFDRELAEKKAEAERQRIAREEELKRQAAEQARREAEEKAARERAEAVRREAELKLKAEQAERARVEAEQRAQREAEEARQRAEREKQAAIEEAQLKASIEAARIKREAEEKEKARLAEEKRIADETAKREADVKHRKVVGTEIVNALLANTTITRDQAKEVLTALKDGLVPRTKIHY
ncbi:hypothetical protein BKC65_02235 [Salmonella enterica subsp. enterica serovar Agona]|nr:hypothetical protein [Salmonella enterica subsp. enterica serovar Agona]